MRKKSTFITKMDDFVCFCFFFCRCDVKNMTRNRTLIYKSVPIQIGKIKSAVEDCPQVNLLRVTTLIRHGSNEKKLNFTQHLHALNPTSLCAKATFGGSHLSTTKSKNDHPY